MKSHNGRVKCSWQLLLSSLVRPSRYNPSRLSSGQHLSGHSHRVLRQFGYQCTSIFTSLFPISLLKATWNGNLNIVSSCLKVDIGLYIALWIANIRLSIKIFNADWCQNSSQDTVKCRVGKTATFHTIFLLYLLSANNSQLKNSIQSIKSVLIGIFSRKLIFQDLQAGPTHYWPPNTGHDAEK